MWHKDDQHVLSVYPVTSYSSEGFYNSSRLGLESEIAFYNNRHLNPILEVWNFENEWSFGLCECNSICNCCFIHFCFPWYLFKLFQRTGEFPLTPFFAPNALMALRAKVRTGLRIRGSLTDDCIKTLCLPCCTAQQLSNEIDIQGL